MKKRMLINFPIVFSLFEENVSFDSFASRLISNIKSELSDITGLKFSIVPFLDYGMLNQHSFCEGESILAPYITEEKLECIFEKKEVEFKNELGEFLRESCCWHDPAEQTRMSVCFNSCDFIVPSYIYFVISFVSEQAKGINEFSKISKQDIKKIKKIIEEQFLSDLETDCFVISPLIGYVYKQGQKQNNVLCILDKKNINNVVIYEADKEDDVFYFSLMLQDLIAEKEIKNNFYSTDLQWKEASIGLIEFNKNRAIIYLDSYDDILEKSGSYLPKYVDEQNILMNMLLKDMEVRCYSINDDGDFISLDNSIDRKFSYYGGAVISKIRKPHLDHAYYINGKHNPLYENVVMSHGQSYIESNEDKIAKSNPVGIGAALYIRHDDGEPFHMVITVFGKGDLVIAEESFSSFNLFLGLELWNIHDKLSDFKKMAARLNIDFWSIEREDDYELDSYEFPIAKKSD